MRDYKTNHFLFMEDIRLYAEIDEKLEQLVKTGVGKLNNIIFSVNYRSSVRNKANDNEVINCIFQ